MYTALLSVRSVPASSFLSDAPLRWPLQISSISEGKYLAALGLNEIELNQIEGLKVGSSSSVIVRGGVVLKEAQLAMLAIIRLAANPPPQVGTMQRRTASRLIRPFPLGLRFSGKNMSPLPCWLGGSQHVALNFSDVDSAVQLHFALFHGSGGFVLKPSEMRTGRLATTSCAVHGVIKRQSSSAIQRSSAPTRSTASESERRTSTGSADGPTNDMDYWPPPREMLHRWTIRILSIHALPKVRTTHPPITTSQQPLSHTFV